MADDDEEPSDSLYEDGHWLWDDNTDKLVFVSDLPPTAAESFWIPTKAPTGAIEFKDDVDLIQQMRFRRQYQRKVKPDEPDVITVQDVKDIALYTAPANILSPALINMLHLATTERFLRALILYTQYYLQIADQMSERMIELENKVRTPYCDRKEKEFRINLSDLRLLVAKEYSTMLIGGGDTKKFHHMGPAKKRRSLSDKDARLIETLLRMCVQIVWLALGRKAFNKIELEINRLFKSEIFNMVEHNLKTGYISKMTKEEKSVLIGDCMKYEKKLNTRSPLMNELFCHREIDYRLVALGVIKCPQMTPRLTYLMLAVAEPEHNLGQNGVTVGILGMSRSAFDIMLKPLPTAALDQSTKSMVKSSMSMRRSQSISSRPSVSKKSLVVQKVYPDIFLPEVGTTGIYFPPSFPNISEKIRPCSETQRRRWQTRLMKMMQIHGRT